MEEFREKIAKGQKNGLLYLGLVLVGAVAVGTIVFQFVENIVCALFAGMGVFFLVLYLVNMYSIGHYKRKGKRVWAALVSCEPLDSVKTQDGKFRCKLTYEILSRPEPTFSEIYAELYERKEPSDGAYIEGYYMEKTGEFHTSADVEALRQNKGHHRLIVGSFGVALIVGVFAKFPREQFGEDFWSISFLWGLALVFLFFGGKMIGGARQRKKSFTEARCVPATLVRFDETEERDSDDDITVYYFPVWSYEYGGEQKEYRSMVSKEKHQNIGDVTELRLDYAGNVYEEREAKTSVCGGVILTVCGVGLLVLAVLLTTKLLPFGK